MRLRLAILVLIPGSSLIAGSPPRAENIAIRSYTTAEGLAHDHVSRIYRDSHGFLWICTDEGLSRYDGRHFVNYTIADGLPHIHVNDIAETRGGEYWIATDGGLTLFRPADAARRFTVFKPDGPPEALFINTVLEEPGGAVLAGTGAGLYRLHPRTTIFEHLTYPIPPGSLQSPAVHTLYLAADQTLWVGATTGLYRHESTGAWLRFDERDGLPSPVVHKILHDPEGRIWICTPHGLARLERSIAAGRPEVDLVVTDASGLPSSDVRSVLFEPDGRRWVATLGGLVEWASGPAAPSNFRIYSMSHGLTDSQVYALGKDVTGGLWIGTRRGGVMRVVRTGFQTFGPADGLVTTGTDRIIEPPSGGICVAAIEDSRRPLRCFDGERFHTKFPRLPAAALRRLPNSNYTAVFDSEGKLWISSKDAVYRLAGGDVLRPDLSLPGESRVLFEDSHHDIWISTLVNLLAGFMRWQRANARLTDLSHTLPDVIRRQGVSAIAEAPDGVLWIGLKRPGGLFRFRRGGFEEVKPVPTGNVQALYRDRAGRIWIASAEAGLGRIDDPAADKVAVRVYGRAHGLSSSELWCLTSDRGGRIYAGSARGVDRIDPATDRITHFSFADGLAGGDIRSALCDRNGSLWFLSNRGLSRFQPVPSGRQPPLETRITGIRVAGVPLAVSDLGQKRVVDADFRWSRNSVQIDFSALAFQSPEQIRYQFRLLGTRDGWSEPSPDATVHFSNLAPGAYQFLVRAVNTDTGGDAAPASFAFTISRPPWQRWWFVTSAGILLALLVYALYGYRLAHLIALERVRTRIAMDLHDDIGSNLSQIAVLSEVAQRRVEEGVPGATKPLAEIASVSRELVDSMSDIVWAIDPGQDRLQDLVYRMRAFAEEAFNARNIEYEFHAPEHGLDCEAGTHLRRQLYLIFKESVNNIVRHSGCTEANIELRAEGGPLILRLSDNGKGFDPTQTYSGHGLKSMDARAKELGGRFEVAVEAGRGTTVTFWAPLISPAVSRWRRLLHKYAVNNRGDSV